MGVLLYLIRVRGKGGSYCDICERRERLGYEPFKEHFAIRKGEAASIAAIKFYTLVEKKFETILPSRMTKNFTLKRAVIRNFYLFAP